MSRHGWKILFLAAAMAGTPVVFGSEKPTGDKPLFVAHYMTWFGRPDVSGSWHQWAFALEGVPRDKHHHPDLLLPDGRRDIAAVHYPVIGPYDSTDPDVLEYHILLAKEAGIDGFKVNWYGFEDATGRRREDRGFAELLRVAGRLGFHVCLNIDEKCFFPPYHNVATRKDAVELAKGQVRRIAEQYGADPAYLKIDGRPVISNFGWTYATADDISQPCFKPAEWKEILDAAGDGRFYFIHDHHYPWRKTIEEAGFLSSADSIFAWIGAKEERAKFLENARQAVREGRMKMVSGHANPGFDNTPCQGWGEGVHKTDRRGGDEYREQLDESIAAGSGFIQLITWNDYTEGSTIEPTQEYGDLYLDITAEYANRWQPGAPYGRSLDIPRRVFELRKKLRRLEASRLVPEEERTGIGQSLEKAISHLLRHQRQEALDALAATENLVAAAEGRLPPVRAQGTSLAPHRLEIFPGGEGEVRLEVVNPLAEKVPLRATLQARDFPQEWIEDSTRDFWAPAEGKAVVSFPVKVPGDAKASTGRFVCAVDSPVRSQETNIVEFRVPSLLLKADLGPLNLLEEGREEALTLRVEVARQDAGEATLEFQAPEGWAVRPERLVMELPATGLASLPLTLMAPAGADTGSLEVKIRAGGQSLDFSEPFKVIGKNRAAVLEGDINQDGVDDFVLGNSLMEAACTPILGARILSMTDRSTGRNQLFLDYPGAHPASGHETEKWIEYGGINDIFPRDWPGWIWNNRWEAKIVGGGPETASVLFSCKAGDFMVEKEIRVEKGLSRARLDYTVENTGSEPQEFFWSNHPDLAPGGKAGPEDVMVVPTAAGRAIQSFRARMQKTHHTPDAGWTLAHDAETGEYLAQTFDPSLVDGIGLWEAENFFTLEVIFKKVGVPSGQRKTFSIDYLTGRAPIEEAIKEIGRGNPWRAQPPRPAAEGK